MAEVSSGGGKPGESIYTALVFFSLLALFAGVGYVYFRGTQVFGSAMWFLPAAS